MNVDIARRLDDAVDALGGDNGVRATSAGTIWKAELRNQYLNAALKAVAVELFNRFGENAIGQIASGFKCTQLITFASGGTTVNANYMYPIRLSDSSGEYKFQVSKAQLDEDLDPYVDRIYVIEGNQLFGYKRSAGTLSQLTSGTATFYYVKADRIVTANTAVGTATVAGGIITALNVTFGGADYQSAPVVTISGGGGSNGAGTAVLTNGVVTSITITNAGSGYTSAPTVSIAAPGGTSGSMVAGNTVPDTTIDAQYTESAELYACGLAWYDKGVDTKDQEMVAKGLSYQALALSKLPQAPAQ
jgi:hypothetical protein